LLYDSCQSYTVRDIIELLSFRRKSLLAGPYKIMITKMFVKLDKVKPSTESIRGLNLAAVKHTTVQVARLS
jgi:hypothetical protein